MYGFISIFPADDKILRGSFFHYSTILLLEQNIFLFCIKKYSEALLCLSKKKGK